MSARDIQFDGAFHALTDHFPFGWQRRLFDRLRSGRDVPRLCYLPTGLGKTSVIPIWLIALAHQAQQDSLIVHDEAHLTPSFSEVLHQVAEAQRQACEPRPMRAIELSATSRGGDCDVLKLGPEDEDDQRTGAIVKARLDATKHLQL